jgi:hypothetical protein
VLLYILSRRYVAEPVSIYFRLKRLNQVGRLVLLTEVNLLKMMILSIKKTLQIKVLLVKTLPCLLTPPLGGLYHLEDLTLTNP